MNTITFSQLIAINGYITCNYIDDIAKGILYFDLKPKINPGNDLIAIALSTLCGRGNYTSIHFDFPIQEKTIDKIKNFCHCPITASNVIKNKADITKTTNALSFSGGFDSLSAKYLMPSKTKLVSMDFGGKFSREKEFFLKFDTHIVTTNVLETHLKRNSWSFMGIAAILFSDYLSIKYHTFGGILEASPSNLADAPVAAKNITFPPFAAATMINAPYTLGITEIGTAMIMLKYAPDLVQLSLDSLANNGETKKYRKQLISSLVANQLNINFKINQFDTPNNKWSFGQSFADDFLAFYFLKHAGIDALSKMMVDIPEEIIQLSTKLSLNFFERINTVFLEYFPASLLPGLLEKAAYAKVIPYTRQDWDELNQVVGILKKYYKI